MKKWIVHLLVVFLLCGCGGVEDVSPGLNLRQCIGNSDGCKFVAAITADYGDRVYDFTTDCSWKPGEGLAFELTYPETIAGITGTIDQKGGKLTFDDTILMFDSMSQGSIMPAMGPWLMMKAVTGGYIHGTSHSEPISITYDDSFQGELLRIVLELDQNSLPNFCEIYMNERRILSIRIEAFQVL